jgi:hypothetical protein
MTLFLVALMKYRIAIFSAIQITGIYHCGPSSV